ncbi:MAG: M20/M25/M40 family metallo-hydrolase [Ginsengibacter sp.]
MKSLFVCLLFYCATGYGQKLKKADKVTLNRLITHVNYLSSDKLNGRRTGTEGEVLAYTYLADQFKSLGLRPKGDSSSYLQHFTIDEGRAINPESFLSVNGSNLKLYDDYFPFSFSGNKAVEATPVIVLQEIGQPWFWDLKSTYDSAFTNPHYDIYDAVIKQTEDVISKGASSLFVYNSNPEASDFEYEAQLKEAPVSIPVVYIKQEAFKKFLNDPAATIDLKLNIDIGPKTRKATNVIGFIDNKADNTIIIGAHYDHLGHGEDGNSLSKDTAIFNGADDNASGTAAVIELARLLTKTDRKNNYLFIFFAAEELGLLGSKYFTEHSPVDISSVNYMINLDMVGRLNPSTKALTLGGVGTSPSWASISKLSGNEFTVKFDSAGVGPSDHTSFYQKEIPVLFFFTGSHADYHKPSDDADKLNLAGTVSIINYVKRIIEAENKAGKIAFTKTAEPPMDGMRFSVTLGIMPDYSFTGEGVKVEAVSKDRPAYKAGIVTGDIIIKLGDNNCKDIYAYMKALNSFKKGDTTIVIIKRNNEDQTLTVTF